MTTERSLIVGALRGADKHGKAPSEIAQATGLSLSSVHFHLLKMRAEGLVVTDGKFYTTEKPGPNGMARAEKIYRLAVSEVPA